MKKFTHLRFGAVLTGLFITLFNYSSQDKYSESIVEPCCSSDIEVKHVYTSLPHEMGEIYSAISEMMNIDGGRNEVRRMIGVQTRNDLARKLTSDFNLIPHESSVDILKLLDENQGLNGHLYIEYLGADYATELSIDKYMVDYSDSDGWKGTMAMDKDQMKKCGFDGFYLAVNSKTYFTRKETINSQIPGIEGDLVLKVKGYNYNSDVNHHYLLSYNRDGREPQTKKVVLKVKTLFYSNNKIGAF